MVNDPAAVELLQTTGNISKNPWHCKYYDKQRKLHLLDTRCDTNIAMLLQEIFESLAFDELHNKPEVLYVLLKNPVHRHNIAVPDGSNG